MTETSAGRGSASSIASSAVEIDDAVRVDRDALGLGHGLQHRTVLDRGNENAGAAAAEQREVIGLGAAADENHAVRRGADQGRHCLARPLDPLPRGAARAMHRGRIAAPCASAAAIAATASGRSGAVAFQSR